ncbi:AIPR family protein [Sphaerotilus montanus]|uniref:AIPR family protein n=1 Tax=Sphaerotilus montanus TaxID=522889 RepID=UPI003FA256E5
MTDIEFYQELTQIVARRAASDHLVDVLAFVHEIADRLGDDPAFGEFVPAEFSGSTSRGRQQFRIHGFTALDESDGSVGLVVGRWFDDIEPETLTTAAVNQLSTYLEMFAQEALNESLCDRIVESNGAYEIALLMEKSKSRISRVRLHIISNQPLSQRFKEKLLEPIGNIAIERHVWDLSRLRSIYESDREREVVVVNLADFGTNGIECMKASGSAGIQSYLCIVPATLLADVFERYGSRVLEGNVRSFLGMKGGVNKGIRRTIQNDPHLFLAFNNGIAATASSVAISINGGRSFISELVDLQIVNGGQTTASILNARIKDRLSLDGVNVAMKLTVVELAGAADLIPRIAEYANTQNKVAVADFFANHPFHRKMEEISRRLFVPNSTSTRVRSKWFYERARGQYQNERLYLSEAKKRKFDLEYPAEQVINKTDLAKYDSVLSEKPHWASLGIQKNFLKFATNFEGKGADTSPAEYWTEISPQYGDVYYQRVVAVALLWKHLEAMVSAARNEWYRGDYRSQIVAYGLAMLAHGAQRSGNEIDWEALWNAQAVPPDLEEALRASAVQAQQVILTLPQGTTNHGEWAKKEACWDRAREKCQDPPANASWLMSRTEARYQRTEARKRGKQDDAIARQKHLLGLSESGYWAALSRWPRLTEIATESQRMLVSRASSATGFLKIVSEKDWSRLSELADACNEAGFRFTKTN